VKGLLQSPRAEVRKQHSDHVLGQLLDA
jgi:hypothetical protein